MKKIVLLATALAMVSGSALAADMTVKAVKAPPPAAFDPWDIAFGSAIMNDYIFRGITQSNHKPSVAAYFEPRYNVTKDVQLYIGTAGESISFPNRAAAKSTSTAVSARPSACSPSTSVSGVISIRVDSASTRGAFPRLWHPGRLISVRAKRRSCLINGNVVKKNASFYEVYGKVNVHHQRPVARSASTNTTRRTS